MELKVHILILHLCFIGYCFGDLCNNPDAELFSQVTSQSATPKGSVYAGTYIKDKKSHTLEDCVVSCCDNELCNTAFFHQSDCFLIQCNTSAPDACEPQHRQGAKFKDTYMVNVRSTEETNDGRFPFDEVGSNYYGVDVRTECNPDKHTGCNDFEECQFVVTETLMGYVCQCQDGFLMDEDGHCVEDNIYQDNHYTSSAPSLNTCIYGLNECGVHETCITKNSRTRSGFCHCDSGYRRSKSTNACIPISPIHDGSTTSGEHYSTVKKVGTTTTHKSMGDQKTTSSSSPSISTTSAPALSIHRPGYIEPIAVSVGGSKTLQLPKDNIILSAYTVPVDTEDSFSYEWTLINQPEGEKVGQMDDINTSKLKLSKLVAGFYTFKITVTGPEKYGEKEVNVTVIPPTRINEPPQAVVKPTTQQVNKPNNVVIDGSSSADDDKIVNYHWEIVSGPLNSGKMGEDTDVESPMLIVKDLEPGSYTFKLTVRDSDGLENSAYANVTVIKETDYPPKAIAGNNVIISLPQNYVTLYGNASTDDKGIVTWEWVRTGEEKLTADMTGTGTPVLHLSNLEVGDYTFTLKVTDGAGQMNSADVNVFVKPESNKPPVAKAGKNRVVFLPVDSTILDGSNSTDDNKIVKWTWTQVSGPSPVELQNSDRAVATAGKLVKGEYKFKLEVSDQEDMTSSAFVTITVKANENLPPEANAGGDKVLELPLDMVILDGTKSNDDRGIVSYIWSRGEKSLAAGTILNGSDHEAILQLTNLVAGRYVFTLTVTDNEGLSDSDTASIVVKHDSNEDDLVELYLDANVNAFTERNKIDLKSQLELLLHVDNNDVQVKIRDISQDSGHLRVIFYVDNAGNGESSVMSGLDVVTTLKQKLIDNADILKYGVLRLDTLVCQNNCSDHGHCLASTKLCSCDAFWMTNFFRVYLGDGNSNCDWSVLYVIIITFIIVVVITTVSWACACMCRRWYNNQPKKRHRYSLLDEIDDERDERVEMLKKGKIQNSSLMVSESDFSSDEETLFINHRKTNGHVRNGLARNGRTKVKT